MSMPRYTWRESALTISAARNCSATASESAVLPVAVVPQMTTSGGRPGSGVERPDERVRTRVFDADVGEAAYQLGVAIEMNELVIAVAPGQPDCAGGRLRIRVTARRPLLIDEHLCRATNPALVRFAADAFLLFEQSLQPALLLGARHVIDELGRWCSGPHGEGGSEDCLEADFTEDFERVLELRLRLTAEADDDVSGQSDARDCGTQLLHEPLVSID